jgi:hypothetical protein
MLKLSDIEIYLAAHRERVVGSVLTGSVEPLLAAVDDVVITLAARLGKVHRIP